MRIDHLYAIVVLVLCLGALAVFAVRVVLRGNVHYDRVNAIGGSPFLSQRLVEMGYWALLPLARFCHARGVTPDRITWASLGLAVGAGVAIASGKLGLGGMLALFSGLGDVLDGQVARLGAGGSKPGELLDSTLDRYMEFAFIGGSVIFYHHHPLLSAIALLALLAAFMVSYSTAKAEALGIKPPRGPMRRHERSVYLISGAVLSSIFSGWLEPFTPWPSLRAPLFLASLAIVAVAGNLSAVRRLVLTARALRDRDRAD
jgi:CDP-diacylglycerol--glycerol-3-phosphate 3-phosphatidyltransferase